MSELKDFKTIFKFTKLSPNANAPKQASLGDAGYDLTSVEDITILKGTRVLIKTGISTEFPANYVAMIKDRSSMAMKGLTVCAGIIDSSYRGEIKVLLHNFGENYSIKTGDKIAQMLLIPVATEVFEEQKKLSDSERGVGGFGSTGV